MSQKETFVLIDTSAIVHRAFHALPPLTTRSGQLVNAVYGFCLILLKIIDGIKPDYIAAAFDCPTPTFRHKEFKEYKAKRVKKGEELYSQFPIVKEVLNAFSIPIYEAEGYEADDVIASLRNKKIQNIIITGDLDALQLVNENTKVHAMKRGLTDIVVYDQEAVKKRYGFSAENIADYKGLAGDASDNIPGVKGIGERTAAELIKKYKTLERIYQKIDEHPEKVRRLLEKGKKDAFLSRKLVVLVEKVPIKFNLEKCRLADYDPQKVAELFYKLDFKSLVSRLPQTKSVQSALFEAEIKSEADKIDRSLEPILREMETTGVQINTLYLNKLSKDINSQILKLKSQIFKKTGGEFNLDSPKQLSQILFVRLALRINGIKRTKTGISTAAPELLKLKGTHPVIDLIIKYRELSKLKSTYLDTLPKMADKKSRIHTTYTQDTQTGRLASKNPNLQNIPIRTDLGNCIRKAFIAPKGFKLVSADYSQIELRVIAHLSKEPRLIFAFKKGMDIHDAVARALKVNRRVAKVINFGIIYGMSAYGLSGTLGVSHQVAHDYIKRFFDLYPDLRIYIQNCIEGARKEGYLETLLGRRRYLPEINSPIPNTRASAERMAVNFPCQGGSADILKLAMVKVCSEVKSLHSKLILTVHDELVFEIPDKKVRKVAKIIKDSMENIYKLEVPLVVGISEGNSWGEMKPLVLK
ncbi:MAG: DNA polymerase [Candidatus Berkelbacteria bacterium]|nr:DNA polymerase [Candidatus Berkelbacteria bacterium]